MDVLALSQSARGADLVRQWNERVAALPPSDAPEGFADLAKILVALLPKVLPILLTILSGGFSPAILLSLLPDLIKQIFPNLDASLVDLLQQIIAHIIGK